MSVRMILATLHVVPISSVKGAYHTGNNNAFLGAPGQQPYPAGNNNDASEAGGIFSQTHSHSTGIVSGYTFPQDPEPIVVTPYYVSGASVFGDTPWLVDVARNEVDFQDTFWTFWNYDEVDRHDFFPALFTINTDTVVTFTATDKEGMKRALLREAKKAIAMKEEEAEEDNGVSSTISVIKIMLPNEEEKKFLKEVSTLLSEATLEMSTIRNRIKSLFRSIDPAVSSTFSTTTATAIARTCGVILPMDLYKDDESLILIAMIEGQNYAAHKDASNRLRNDKNFVLRLFENVETADHIRLKDIFEGITTTTFSESDKKEIVLAAASRIPNGAIYHPNGRGDMWNVVDSTLKADKEVMLALVKGDGTMLQFAGGNLRGDEELVLTAVKQNGLALQYVYPALQTRKDVALAAVTQNGEAYREIWCHYAEKFGVHGNSSPSQKTLDHREIVLAAVKQNGDVFEKYLSQQDNPLKKDTEVLFAALKQGGRGGVKRTNRKVVLTAVGNDGMALRFASNEIRFTDEQIVLKAVEQNGLALKFAAGFWGNRKVVLAAAEQNGESLFYAEEDLKKDKSLVISAIKDGKGPVSSVLKYADITLKEDIDVVLAAVSIDGMALQHAAESLKNNKRIVLAAVGDNGHAWQYAAAELRRDEEVEMKAVEKDGMALQWSLVE